jgi:hypothetical protein
MNKKIITDLRKKQPPVAPSSRTANLPGFKGTLPTKMGTLISGDVHLTAAEEKMLKAAGWQPGQAIPTNIGGILEEERTRLQEEAQTALAASPSTPEFKPPQEIAWEDLTAEKRQEIMQELISAQEKLKFQGYAQIPGAAPGINRAISQANDAAYDEFQKGQIQVVNSKKPPQVVHGHQELIEKSIRQAPINQSQTPVPPTVSEESTVASAGAAELPQNCDHCGWQYGVPDVIATQEDKYNFEQAVLGLGTNRFYKTYKLFDGKLHVTFRTLTSKESDLVYRQVALDNKKGRVENMQAYYLALMNYRLACSLDKIQSSDGTLSLPEISEYKVDGIELKEKDADTQLVEVSDHIIETAVPQESIRRVVINKLAHFHRLVEHLEARIEDEGFWNATEGQL